MTSEDAGVPIAERRVEIINRLGMHARSAARFVEEASRFRSTIEVEGPRRSVNGKSIMGLMMLAAAQGTQLTMRASGEDAEAAVEQLARLVADRFGESE